MAADIDAAEAEAAKKEHVRRLEEGKGTASAQVARESAGRFFPLCLRFSIGKCRNCPLFRAFKSEMKGKTAQG
jgi:hypothetical protein